MTYAQARFALADFRRYWVGPVRLGNRNGAPGSLGALRRACRTMHLARFAVVAR